MEDTVLINTLRETNIVPKSCFEVKSVWINISKEVFKLLAWYTIVRLWLLRSSQLIRKNWTFFKKILFCNGAKKLLKMRPDIFLIPFLISMPPKTQFTTKIFHIKNEYPIIK